LRLLGDFGLVRLLESTCELAHSRVGTPYYLSPVPWEILGSRAEQGGAGRSRAEQGGAGRSRAEQGGALGMELTRPGNFRPFAIENGTLLHGFLH